MNINELLNLVLKDERVYKIPIVHVITVLNVISDICEENVYVSKQLFQQPLPHDTTRTE